MDALHVWLTPVPIDIPTRVAPETMAASSPLSKWPVWEDLLEIPVYMHTHKNLHTHIHTPTHLLSHSHKQQFSENQLVLLRVVQPSGQHVFAEYPREARPTPGASETVPASARRLAREVAERRPARVPFLIGGQETKALVSWWVQKESGCWKAHLKYLHGGSTWEQIRKRVRVCKEL